MSPNEADEAAAHALDLERDEDQSLGVLSSEVLGSLRPGFEPQDRTAFVNPVRLRRRLAGRPDYVDRVASLNQSAGLLPGCLERAKVFVRYDKAKPGEAGVTADVPLPAGRDHVEYLGIGLHLCRAKDGAARRNHVTTLIPPISERRLHARPRRAVHFPAR
jgi:hypothetical protein